MENSMIKRINTLGRVGYFITKIGEIVLIIAAVACLIGGVLMCFVPKEAVKIEIYTSNSAVLYLDESIDLSGILEFDDDEGFLEIGDNTYKLIIDDEKTSELQRNVIYFSDFKWILFAAVLVCAAAYAVLYFANRLCSNFRSCETPFTEKISKEILNLAWSLIPISVIGAFIESLAEFVLMDKIEINISVDLITVILILCIFMLSYIFKYGTELQTESDQTL